MKDIDHVNVLVRLDFKIDIKKQEKSGSEEPIESVLVRRLITQTNVMKAGNLKQFSG